MPSAKNAPITSTADGVASTEEAQYIYNIDAAGFIKGANDWGTRVSVESTGLKLNIIEFEEGCYGIGVGAAQFSPDGTDGIWIDGARDGYNKFTLTEAEEGVYQIGCTKFEGTTMGILKSLVASNTRLNFYEKAPEGDELFDKWVFVGDEDYNAISAALPQYKAGSALENLIAEAEELYPGIDLSDEKAVCENLESTVEQLNNAFTKVQEKMAAAAIAAAAANATPEKPYDLSGAIVNPGFEGATGWTGGPALNNGVAEFYNKNYTLTQEIKNMPAGVYALSVQGFYRAGSAENSYECYKNGNIERNALLYAFNGTDTITTPLVNALEGIAAGEKVDAGGNYVAVADGDYTYYVPNNMATAANYFAAGRYTDNVVMFAVTDGKLSIGLTKNKTLNIDWTLFDNFALKFYGNVAGSFQCWMDQILTQYPADAYDEVEKVTASYVEAYKDALENNTEAADYATVLANKAAIIAAQAAIEANIAAWKALEEQVKESRAVATNDKIADCTEKEDLGDYLDDTVADALDELELTTEQIYEMIEELKRLTKAAKEALTVGAELEIKNWNFSDGKTGWTFTPSVTDVKANCAESWNQASFDYYQLVEGAPTGVYEITMQGFYRAGSNNVAWPAYFNADGSKKDDVPATNAYVYLNDSKTNIANVYDYPVANGELYMTKADYEAEHGAGTFVGPDPYVDTNEEYWYPNGMTIASMAFDEGYYSVSAKGLVQEGQEFRIGVKGSTANEAWAIFTRFKVVFKGYDAEIIAPMLTEELAKLDTTKPMGTEVVAKIDSIKQVATEVLATNVGRDMMKVISAIYEIEEEMAASIKVFENLDAQKEALNDAIAFYGETAKTDVKNEATALYMEIDDAEGLTTADAQELIDRVVVMVARLAIPRDVETASDENPVDLTAVIRTPGFDNEGVNSIDGWQVTGYNFGNDATQKAALCLEFYEKDFNIYQDLHYLPAGTYSVKVFAFFRGAESTSSPVLYAKCSTDSVCAPVMVRDSLVSDATLSEGESELKDEEGDVIGYVPNNMVSSRAYFDAGFYENEVVIKTTEDEGTLRIGVSAENHQSGDWVIMDDWSLIYYGANSDRPVGIEEMSASKVVKVEIYNLNGQKVSAAVNGVYVVRMTLADGSVVSNKIVK